ncbi:MAG TPA: cytochrome c oxidase assembly protein [Streptosporangiaceae bacterium]|nr:cytochrome c oxidase assembly protein [Streptosporangiaceae bacterium]
MSLVLGHWSADWLVLIPYSVIVALHLTGFARMRAAAREPDRDLARQAAVFQAGLAAVLIAFVSPIDYWSDQYLWIHMIQHLLLVVVACPLIVLGAPWLVVLRAIPRPLRQRLGRAVLLEGRPLAIRRALRGAARPVPVALAFNLTWWLWHLPALYDLALRYTAVHYLEHGTYLAAGLALWLQLIGSHPWSPPLSPLRRAPIIFFTAVSNWVMAILLGFSTTPWYPAYAQVAHGAFSAGADQQLAAAVMWVGMEPSFVVALVFVLNTWLREEDNDVSALLRRPRTSGWH